MNMKEAARAAKEKSAELMDKFRSKGSHMLSEEKIFFETLDDPETVKQLLLHVVDGIDRGRVILANEEEEMVFYPGSLLKLTIRGKRAQSTSKINLSISWSRLDEDRVTLDDEPTDMVDADVRAEVETKTESAEPQSGAPEAQADAASESGASKT
ncbi:MAG: amphi-Trp domain-containing protein [Desulfovibrio sp.]